MTNDALPDDARSVLDVWFEGVGEEPLGPDNPAGRRWFAKDPAFDGMLRARFGSSLEVAARGELGGWCATARGTLAFVVLCDQFSRNVFRDTARSFANDPLALHACLGALARRDFEALTLAERGFLYMPLMHSESLAMHDLARDAFGAALAHAEASAPGWAPYCRNTLAYEGKHRAIIERFGRYPHRNAILGRASTEAEVEFLAQPGSSF